MKAPKLLLALGFSVPILAQSCDICRPHASETAVDSHHHSASPVEARDADLHHRDHDKPPPTIPQNMPFRPPPPGSVEQRDADRDLASDNDPPKHRCNPISPFCVDPPLSEESIEEHTLGNEIGDVDAPEVFDSDPTQHSQVPDYGPRESDFEGDKAFTKTFLDDLNVCYKYPDLCWKHATDQYIKRDGVPAISLDESPRQMEEALFPWALKCIMLHAVCENKGLPCACNLAERCSRPETSALTSREVMTCIGGDDSHFAIEAQADKSFRCVIAQSGCVEHKPCLCRLSQQCSNVSGDGPSYDAIFQCGVNMIGDGLAHLAARDDDAEEKISKECRRAFDWCRRGISRCACHWSRRCHKKTPLSSNDADVMKKCLHDTAINSPRDAPPYPPFAASLLHHGDATSTTMVLTFATLAASVSQTSPVVIVETAGIIGSDEGVTMVKTLIGSRPTQWAEVGIAGQGHSETTTVTGNNDLWDVVTLAYGSAMSTLQKRDMPASFTPQHAHPTPDVEGEAVTYNVLGGTAAISVADATPNVVVATYGDESESGTLMASAIETDPPAVAFSGAWDDVPISATTVALGSDAALDDLVYDLADHIEEDLEDDLDLDLGDVDLDDFDLDDAPELIEDYLGENSSMAKRDGDEKEDTDMEHKATQSASTTSVVVLGNNSAPYVRATDAQGRPIYVTRTGEFAANTKTLTFSESVRPASTTRQGGSVEYRVITKTVRPTTTIRRNEVIEYRVVTTTKTVYGQRCTPHRTPVLADKTVVDLESTQVPYSNWKHSQAYNGTVVRIAHPQATLKPLIWKAAYTQGFEHLFGVDELKLTQMFAGHDIDWKGVRDMSYHLREENGELVPELNFKKALIMHLRSQRGDPAPYASITTLNTDNVGQYFKWNASVAEINGTRHAMNQTTQTINGQPVVVDPLWQYRTYDARHHRVAPTPACVGNTGVHGLLGGRGKKECEIEKCMWKHMRPLEIQTVFPAAMRDDGCGQIYDYFTQKSKLEDPHWGTTESRGTYYPVAWSKTAKTVETKHFGTKSKDVQPTCALKRQYPDGFDPKTNENRAVHGDPSCSDLKSCHVYCTKHHGFSLPEPVLLGLAIGLPLAVGIPILLLLCCCLPAWGLHRHNRRKNANAAGPINEKERRPSVMDKLRRKSTGQPGGVVNAVTGQATDPATGRAIEGGPGAASAIAASSAAGAAAAGGGGGSGGSGDSKGDGAASGGAGSGAGGGSGAGAPGGADSSSVTGGGDPVTKVIGGGGADDGKGTLGRQAEEGRSRVHFDEAPKAVSDAEPHVEAVGGGPPKTDGTIESASGREWADVGSMRGRKRARPEGPQGLNLGF